MGTAIYFICLAASTPPRAGLLAYPVRLSVFVGTRTFTVAKTGEPREKWLREPITPTCSRLPHQRRLASAALVSRRDGKRVGRTGRGGDKVCGEGATQHCGFVTVLKLSRLYRGRLTEHCGGYFVYEYCGGGVWSADRRRRFAIY